MLLKLEKNATLNKFVKIIKLPKKNGKTPANVKCHVVGWGQTRGDLRPSNVLKEATEKTQFSSECENIWGSTFNFHHMICSKFTKKDGGVCEGDSGGPLICNRRPQGVTAFIMKDNCNNPKYPHVFTKYNFFLLHGWRRKWKRGLLRESLVRGVTAFLHLLIKQYDEVKHMFCSTCMLACQKIIINNWLYSECV